MPRVAQPWPLQIKLGRHPVGILHARPSPFRVQAQRSARLQCDRRAWKAAQVAQQSSFSSHQRRLDSVRRLLRSRFRVCRAVRFRLAGTLAGIEEGYGGALTDGIAGGKSKLSAGETYPRDEEGLQPG
jgi:hypothetical protein